MVQCKIVQWSTHEALRHILLWVFMKTSHSVWEVYTGNLRVFSYIVDVVWFMRLNVNWYSVNILIGTSQPLQIAHDVHEFHIHEILICNALCEALAKNESLQSTSGPQGIIIQRAW